MSQEQVRYPKRLIEVDLPIGRISAHARREKSIRHGHISTLHIWWARRPLAACRAVVCAALWPDPVDLGRFNDHGPVVPEFFLKTAQALMQRWAQEYIEKASVKSQHNLVKVQKGLIKLEDPDCLRLMLLDFIADFSDWDRSCDSFYLDTARQLTRAASHTLYGDPDRKPLVLDPFAGGGAIPLEALRCGADAFASDSNDIPVFLNKVMLEQLTDASDEFLSKFECWAAELRSNVQKRLDVFMPSRGAAKPFAYFWARKVRCEGTGCGRWIPLLGSPILRSRTGSSVAISIEYPNGSLEPKIVFKGADDPDVHATVRGGAATCICGVTTPVSAVRRQLSDQHGGADTAQLLAIGFMDEKGNKVYLPPIEADFVAIAKAREYVKLHWNTCIDGSDIPIFPDEPLWGKAKMNVGLYGIQKWREAFTSRQLLQLAVFQEELQALAPKLRKNGDEGILSLLLIAIDKLVDYSTSLCRWVQKGEFVAATNGGEKKIPMMWDFCEVALPNDGPGSFHNMIKWLALVVRHFIAARIPAGHAEQSDARISLLPHDSVDLVFTDPPYYSAIWYCDLSDMFAVWLRRGLLRLGYKLSKNLREIKEAEIIRSDFSKKDGLTEKDDAFYESGMQAAFHEQRLATKPDGLGIVVFAHKSTAGWESVLKGLIEAGWVITGSWPIDTERGARMTALGQSALASSVHIVCRPRENSDGSLQTDKIGEWSDVLARLPIRLRDWLRRLSGEGVVGADAIFACLGPALEIFSEYSRVEKSNGEVVSLGQYLEQVWAAVSKEALSTIFSEADATTLDPDARLTAMWLWTLNTGAKPDESDTDAGSSDETDEDTEDDSPSSSKPSGYVLEYDAARKISQGLGVHLEKATTVVEIRKDQARLLPVVERAQYLFGKKSGAAETNEKQKNKRNSQSRQISMFPNLDRQADLPLDQAATTKPHDDFQHPEIEFSPGETILDRLHQAMILFADGRGGALRKLLVEDGVGKDARVWKLAQSLSALYPTGSDEKRWVDGVLARKKGLGL